MRRKCQRQPAPTHARLPLRRTRLAPPYGDHSPETSFVDNGKNGKLAMTAAATLIPDSGKSVYAEARDQMGQ